MAGCVSQSYSHKYGGGVAAYFLGFVVLCFLNCLPLLLLNHGIFDLVHYQVGCVACNRLEHLSNVGRKGLEAFLQGGRHCQFSLTLYEYA